MKRLFAILLLAFALSPGAYAQLSKLMSKYHEQSCATVTQLDKSLYGLYQRNNLPPEAEEMLQKLDEVNLLNLDLEACIPEMAEQTITRFREVLDRPDKYKLTKSHNDGSGKQLIYTRQKDGKVTDLVVWNQNPQRLDIIELRGDIQLDQIALLSKALNLKGLNSLARLSSHPDVYENYKQQHAFSFPDMDTMADQMRDMQERMQQYFGFGEEMPGDSLMARPNPKMPGNFGEDFPGWMEDLMNQFNEFPGWMDGFMQEQGLSPEQMKEMYQNGGFHKRMEKIFRSFGNGEDVMSNSVQVTEENGKTKIKIDSKNSDMTYIIDGKEAPKDNVQMPERILNVNIIPSKEDLKKSYLFITSKDKIGEFISYKDGVLTFRYEQQEYKYNLDKSEHPLLVINGRLASGFDLDPQSILQIRPLSQIEKEAGYYPNAEVMIQTGR